LGEKIRVKETNTNKQEMGAYLRFIVSCMKKTIRI
jgi:hypothetical protein